MLRGHRVTHTTSWRSRETCLVSFCSILAFIAGLMIGKADEAPGFSVNWPLVFQFPPVSVVASGFCHVIAGEDQRHRSILGWVLTPIRSFYRLFATLSKRIDRYHEAQRAPVILSSPRRMPYVPQKEHHGSNTSSSFAVTYLAVNPSD